MARFLVSHFNLDITSFTCYFNPSLMLPPQVMFQVRKDKFKDHVSVMEALELVEEDDQFTHMITLDDATNAEDMLSMFL